jgi:phosphoribosylcarboxyaminoimidazole (NCAIR) mutase
MVREEMNSNASPIVGIIMGSKSDWDTMSHAADILETLGVPHEIEVVSAHRTPEKLFEYASSAESRGLEVIIAGAGIDALTHAIESYVSKKSNPYSDSQALSAMRLLAPTPAVSPSSDGCPLL